MDRRRFLKGVGLASAAGLAGLSGLSTGSSGGSGAPMRGDRMALREAATGVARFRVDGSSRVYVSRDEGATWSVHAKFGEDLSVRGIRTGAGGKVRIHVAHGPRTFTLALSASGRTWITT
jgi:hypothetical protein